MLAIHFLLTTTCGKNLDGLLFCIDEKKKQNSKPFSSSINLIGPPSQRTARAVIRFSSLNFQLYLETVHLFCCIKTGGQTDKQIDR